MERPRTLAHPGRALGQGHPLVAAQSARTSDHRTARHPLGSPAGQHPPLPRLPAARRAAAALPPARPDPRARPPRRLAGLGIALPPAAVRPPRAHPASAPRGHPRRDPARALQRPPRRPQQQDPPDQPPQLRLSLRRRPHRPRLPLLHRHRHYAAAMNFTPNSTGVPFLRRSTSVASVMMARAEADASSASLKSEGSAPSRSLRITARASGADLNFSAPQAVTVSSEASTTKTVMARTIGKSFQ